VTGFKKRVAGFIKRVAGFIKRGTGFIKRVAGFIKRGAGFLDFESKFTDYFGFCGRVTFERKSPIYQCPERVKYHSAVYILLAPNGRQALARGIAP
jgi:hypothetical protein